MTTTIDTSEMREMWTNIEILGQAQGEACRAFALLCDALDATRAMCEGAERAEREQRLRAEVAEEALAEHRSGAALVKALDRAEKAEAEVARLERLVTEEARLIGERDSAIVMRDAYKRDWIDGMTERDAARTEAEALRAAASTFAAVFRRRHHGRVPDEVREALEALDAALAAKPEPPGIGAEVPRGCTCRQHRTHDLGLDCPEHDAPRVDSEAVASDADGEG